MRYQKRQSPRYAQRARSRLNMIKRVRRGLLEEQKQHDITDSDIAEVMKSLGMRIIDGKKFVIVTTHNTKSGAEDAASALRKRYGNARVLPHKERKWATFIPEDAID